MRFSYQAHQRPEFPAHRRSQRLPGAQRTVHRCQSSLHLLQKDARLVKVVTLLLGGHLAAKINAQRAPAVGCSEWLGRWRGWVLPAEEMRSVVNGIMAMTTDVLVRVLECRDDDWLHQGAVEPSVNPSDVAEP